MRIIFYLLLCLVSSPSFASNQEKCIKINTISVNEHQLFNKDAQSILLQKYLNKCVEPSTFNDIVTSVSQYYIDNGYITTKAYLKEQNIQDGILEVDVFLGILKDIVDANTSQTNSKIFTAFLFQKDEPLNLRDLETSLEMMNRVPSSKARFEIKPGNRAWREYR